MNTAFKLFICKGYQGTSLNAIAKKSGLTKGGIYHYFDSKENLYYQVLKDFFTPNGIPKWLENIDLNIKDLIWKGFESLKEKKKYIQDLVGSDTDDAILHYYTFLYEATRKYPEFQRAIDESDKLKIGVLTAAFKQAQERGEIRQDLDPEVLSFELDALLQQLSYLNFVNPGIKQNQNMFKRLFDNYWLRLKV
ncbi:TetR/AcrR family transcriptional regulator [Orenia metallireducens]|uniref:TetR/AcrR family transcriptional regulator n=1 Tax=Orenia metallireducens TaxID=1413210 RepID=UPI0024816E7B|nr:TetR/AcrR family transcriptional regulator [Orenia metallireducens]